MKVQKSFVGIAMIIFALFLMTTKDALVKLTGGIYSPVLIVWTQLSFLVVVYLPYVIWRYGAAAIIPKPFGWQFMRGLFVVTAVGLFYWAISIIPLADTVAMAFVSPMIVTALSPLVLNEKIGLRRWMAVIIGFLGILIVLRPDFEGVRSGYLIAISAGIFLAFFYLSSRKLADDAPPIPSATYSAMVGAIILIPVLPMVWTPPQPEHFWPITGFLAFSLVGQTLLVMSFRYAAASTLAPFHYTQILGATFYGYLFFSDFPDRFTLIGIAVVISCGAYIAYREKRAHQQI